MVLGKSLGIIHSSCSKIYSRKYMSAFRKQRLKYSKNKNQSHSTQNISLCHYVEKENNRVVLV